MEAETLGLPSFRIGICNAWPDGLIWKTIYQRIIGRIPLFRRTPFHDQINRNIVERLGFPVSPPDRCISRCIRFHPARSRQVEFRAPPFDREIYNKASFGRMGRASINLSTRIFLWRILWRIRLLGLACLLASSLLTIAQVCAHARATVEDLGRFVPFGNENKEEGKRRILIVRDENRRFFIFKREEF